MITTDWPVYPIFIIQTLAFLGFFFRANACFLGIKAHTWIIVLLMAANIGIGISLHHDSTDILHLHF